MLVLGRRKGESITITTAAGEVIEVFFLGESRFGDSGKLGFKADPSVRINRTEIEEQRNEGTDSA